MRQIRFAGIFIAICVVTLSVFAVAGQNQMGVANKYEVTFPEKVWVANTILPEGTYEIRHVMEGPDHVMVFRQLRVQKHVEVRAKCQLVSLPEKAGNSQKIYTINAANERVLHELIFRGDLAKHVF